jgi:exosortase K
MKTKAATLALVAFVMWQIKRYYAGAQVDALRWILSPTTWLVTMVTATPFEWQPGEGYLSRERLFLIEKACAGINFMIAAFGMTAYVLRRRMSSAATGAAVVVVSLGASYIAAVGVNALRITAALWLAAHSFRIAGMNAVQLHRLEGIVFYFGGLVVLHEIVRRFDGRSGPLRLTTPLVSYYALTLAVPLVNGAGRNGAAFIEYALFVLIFPLAVIAFAAAASRLADRLSARPSRNASGAILCQLNDRNSRRSPNDVSAASDESSVAKPTNGYI